MVEVAVECGRRLRLPRVLRWRSAPVPRRAWRAAVPRRLAAAAGAGGGRAILEAAPSSIARRLSVRASGGRARWVESLGGAKEAEARAAGWRRTRASSLAQCLVASGQVAVRPRRWGRPWPRESVPPRGYLGARCSATKEVGQGAVGLRCRWVRARRQVEVRWARSPGATPFQPRSARPSRCVLCGRGRSPSPARRSTTRGVRGR